MQEFTFLKIDYLDGLRFKHMINYGSKVDFCLNIYKRDAIRLVEYIHDVLVGNIKSSIIRSFGRYDISVSMIEPNTFTISIMETIGQKCRPIGDFMYSGYMGNIHMLDGLRKAKQDISNS